MTTKTPQYILATAADILEADGWCQGVARDQAGRHCALGAIGTAAHKDGANLLTREAFELQDAATDMLQAHLEVDWVHEWNDKPGRTKDEVVQALRAAAEWRADQ